MSVAAFGLAASLLVISFAASAIRDAFARPGEQKFDFGVSPSHTTLFLLRAGSLLFVVLLWLTICATGIVDAAFLPSPGRVFAALFEMVYSGELWPHLFASVRRIAIAFGLAAVIGFALGTLIGSFPRFAAVITPVNSSLRYIPPTAFIGLTIIWFGIAENSKYVLIAIATVFYLVQMIADAVALVPRLYIDAARTLGAGRFEVLRSVVLRMGIPEVVAALRINLGAAWTYLIVAEIVAAQSGLGYLMATSQRFLQTERLFALLIIVGILGYLTDATCTVAIRYLGRWK
jgi:NitT/TauT family transport system permease protein